MKRVWFWMMIVGLLALAHTALYAFTGISFAAPTNPGEARGALLVVLHFAAMFLGAFGASNYFKD